MNEKLKIFATAILGKTLSATAYGRTDETQDRRGTDGRIPRVRPHQTRAGITHRGASDERGGFVAQAAIHHTSPAAGSILAEA